MRSKVDPLKTYELVHPQQSGRPWDLDTAPAPEPRQVSSPLTPVINVPRQEASALVALQPQVDLVKPFEPGSPQNHVRRHNSVDAPQSQAPVSSSSLLSSAVTGPHLDKPATASPPNAPSMPVVEQDATMAPVFSTAATAASVCAAVDEQKSGGGTITKHADRMKCPVRGCHKTYMGKPQLNAHVLQKHPQSQAAGAMRTVSKSKTGKAKSVKPALVERSIWQGSEKLASTHFPRPLLMEFRRQLQLKEPKFMSEAQITEVQRHLGGACLQLEARDRLRDLREQKTPIPANRAVSALGQYLAEVAHSKGVTVRFQHKLNAQIWKLVENIHMPGLWRTEEYLCDSSGDMTGDSISKSGLWIDKHSSIDLVYKLQAVEKAIVSDAIFKAVCTHFYSWLVTATDLERLVGQGHRIDQVHVD